MNEEDKRLMAGRVAGRSDLVDIRLVRSSLEHKKFRDSRESLAFKLDVSPTAQYELGSEFLVVLVDYALTVTQSDSDDELATVEFQMAALFDTDASVELSPEEVQTFAQTTGAFAVYPYAREYVQDVTGRLGLPPLTLGLFKVANEEPERAGNAELE